jgi:hypothetical protein
MNDKELLLERLAEQIRATKERKRQVHKRDRFYDRHMAQLKGQIEGLQLAMAIVEEEL